MSILKTLKTADLCDEYSENIAICNTDFKSYGKKSLFAGPICTVEVFEDNVLVRDALETIPNGSVLVVNGGGSRKCALMGDRLGDIAVSRGLAGVIINGCVRDVAELMELDLGILAIGSNPLKSNKGGKGKRDNPVKFGGVTWEPGHYVYADEDGVIVSETALQL